MALNHLSAQAAIYLGTFSLTLNYNKLAQHMGID